MRLKAFFTLNLFGAVSSKSGSFQKFVRPEHSVLNNKTNTGENASFKRSVVLLLRSANVSRPTTANSPKTQGLNGKRRWMLTSDCRQPSKTADKTDAHSFACSQTGINSTESKRVHDSWLKSKRLKLDLFRFKLLPKSLTSQDDRFPKPCPGS